MRNHQPSALFEQELLMDVQAQTPSKREKKSRYCLKYFYNLHHSYGKKIDHELSLNQKLYVTTDSDLKWVRSSKQFTTTKDQGRDSGDYQVLRPHCFV